jgi:ssDNA-binding Zn-finger/Zn-ribbon topoisomerase 1
MNNLVCKECNSDDLLKLDNNEYIYKSYTIVEKRSGVVYTTETSTDFPIKKYVCLNCGHVFEVMKKETLDKYQKLRVHFE